MTINVILNDLVNLQNENTAVTQINQNSSLIETAFSSALNTTGDQMQGTLDMNSNQLINLPAPATANSAVRLQDLSTVSGGGTVSNIPAGGNTGDSLVKNSNANYDIEWSPNASDISAGTGLVTSGSNPTVISISPTAVTSGTYGSSSVVPVLTVNAQGQLTAASTSAVVAPAGTLTGTTLAGNVLVSSLTSVGSLTNLTLAQSSARSFEIDTRSNITAYPAITLRPNTVTSNLALDLVPNGTATSGEGNITWFDVCSTDLVTAPTGSVAAARVGFNISNGAAQYGSVAYGGASTPSVQIIRGVGNVVATNTATGWALGTETNPQYPFVLSQNVAQSLTTIPGTTMQLVAADSSTALFTIASFGSGTAISQLRAQGTASSPTAVAAGQGLGVYGFGGYNGTSWVQNVAFVRGSALENFTASSNGTYISFNTTLSGTTVSVQAGRFMGGFIVGPGTVDPGAGNLSVGGTVSATTLVVTGNANVGTVTTGTWSATAISSAAGTLTGTTLAGNVVASSLTSVGVLAGVSTAAPVILPRYTVTSLPSSVTGAIVVVTDALAPTFLGTFTGGGTTKSLAVYDGSAWRAA